MTSQSKKFFSLISVLIFLIPLSPLINEKLCFSDTPFENNSILNGGWLEEQNGVKILHLNGSYYDMGYQHGFLLKEEVLQNFRAFIDASNQHGWNYDKLVDIWEVMKNYLPQDFIEEMWGMANGSGLTFEQVTILHTVPAVINLFSCWGSAAWGTATTDGTLVHVRSLDGIYTIQDPISGTYLHDNQVLIIRKPENGFASMCPQFSGDICCWGGINENGIAIGELSQWCTDTTFHGINGAFRMRMVMDYASTASDALDIMNSNRTCGWNFIVTDSKIPNGFIVEQTANLLYVGEWMNPTESIPPFWTIEDVVRRGNLFINPLLAALQRDIYDPSGFAGFARFMFGKNSYFVVWSQYKAMSDEIERQYGNLDLDTTIWLMRHVYKGRTSIIFNFMRKIGVYQPAHQWVACPERGDMVISFAEGKTLADKTSIHYFNLFELLQSEIP